MKKCLLGAVLSFFFLSSFASAKIFVQQQKASSKVDILFVIDNSGTMETSAKQLIQSFPAFIQKLEKSNIDFHIGVTTTDTYIGKYYPNESTFRLRDGSGINSSGVYVVTPQTPDLANVLAINLKQGATGSGDERAFSSFMETLNFAGNNDFRRADASLAIITLSDEDDFSSNAKDYYFTEDYNDPNIIPMNEMMSFLAAQGGPAPATFSTISILDENCKKQIGDSWGMKISRRYIELSDATSGFKGSLCQVDQALEGFAKFIGTDVVTPVPTEYTIKLDHTPIVETIAVRVNGQWIPQDAANGWTYDTATVTVTLHGQSVPEKGDMVSVTYDYKE